MADRGLYRGVKLHPGHIAVVIVVRQQCGRALLEKDLERGLGRQRGGRPQLSGGQLQLGLERHAVPGVAQLSVRPAPDQAEEACRLLALSVR